MLYMPAHREKKEKGVESGLDALQQLQSAHLSQYNDDDEEVAEEKLSDDKESDVSALIVSPEPRALHRKTRRSSATTRRAPGAAPAFYLPRVC